MGRILTVLQSLDSSNLVDLTVSGTLTVETAVVATGCDVTADTFTPSSVPEITGEFPASGSITAAETMLQSLLAALDTLGLITDSTTQAA